MRYWMSFFSFAICLALLTGCEWDSTDDEDSWDDSMSWVDFSGFYRSSGGGVLVAPSGQTEGSETNVLEESYTVTTAAQGQKNFTGAPLVPIPIVPGSVTFTVGTYSVNDDGTGGLFGGDVEVGSSISYTTGAWNFELTGLALVEEGTPVTVSFSYYSGGEGAAEGGNSGALIYSFVVTQTGNKLKFVDNNGGEYTGRLDTMETPGGDDTGQTSGYVVGNFEVAGDTAEGVTATIVGSFTAAYTAPTTGEASGTMGQKQMDASWIEETSTGDIDAVAE